MQVAELAHFVCVRPVAVLPRHLEDGGQTLEPSIAEEDPELLAQHAFADVCMAVAVRAQLRGRVVHVHGT